jgi:hypothetical protein
VRACLRVTYEMKQNLQNCFDQIKVVCPQRVDN